MNNTKHLLWIIYGIVVSFLTSFIFGDLLILPLDIYYLIYFAIITGFVILYAKATDLSLREWLSRKLIWGVILGLAFAIFMIQNVLSRPETEKLSGSYLVWSIFWRGLVYGAIDGILLYAFPWLVTWRAFRLKEKSLGKKIGFSILAWVFILLITTTYHLGYSDFRSEKIIQPNIGSTIMSVPTLLSTNPVSSVITHVAMHITAVIHSPKTPLFLPPHRE
jgi:hypothetical protein